MQDCSAEVAEGVADATTYDRSENIRHGTYKFLIRRVRTTPIKGQQGVVHKYGFWELTTLESKPNPQVEGDHIDYPGVAGPLKDDGMKPNVVGSNCALKADFDGPAAIMARANIQDAILAFFNKKSGEISKEEIQASWIDLCRLVPLKVGEYDQATKKISDKAKPANPACGFVIGCTTMTVKKKTPNEKGAYVTKLNWFCIAPLGTGENSMELVAKRRAEIEKTLVDDDGETAAPASPQPQPQAQVPQIPTAPAMAPVAPPPAPPAPQAPSPPVAFTPPSPWEAHPTAAAGTTPATRWFWSNPAHGGNNAVKSEEQLRSGQN